MYTVLDSWWWTENLSETCRVLFQISASRCFYYKNISRCTVLCQIPHVVPTVRSVHAFRAHEAWTSNNNTAENVTKSSIPWLLSWQCLVYRKLHIHHKMHELYPYFGRPVISGSWKCWPNETVFRYVNHFEKFNTLHFLVTHLRAPAQKQTWRVFVRNRQRWHREIQPTTMGRYVTKLLRFPSILTLKCFSLCISTAA